MLSVDTVDSLLWGIHGINTLNSSVVYLKDLAIYFDYIYT